MAENRVVPYGRDPWYQIGKILGGLLVGVPAMVFGVQRADQCPYEPEAPRFLLGKSMNVIS